MCGSTLLHRYLLLHAHMKKNNGQQTPNVAKRRNVLEITCGRRYVSFSTTDLTQSNLELLVANGGLNNKLAEPTRHKKLKCNRMIAVTVAKQNYGLVLMHQLQHHLDSNFTQIAHDFHFPYQKHYFTLHIFTDTLIIQKPGKTHLFFSSSLCDVLQ